MSIQLKINGIALTAEENETVLSIARRNGIEIPTLCHHDSVEPIGACRVCLVEMKTGGKSQITTCCNAAAEDGMEILTDTEEVKKERRANLEMILGRAPQSLKVRELARQYMVYESRYVPTEEADVAGCILCELCVRVCERLGHGALAAISRGGKKHIGTPHGKPSESCVGCGACTAVCPTSCIPMKDTRISRDIWGRQFKFVACVECSAPVMTEEHRKHAIESGELAEDFYTTCVVCKQKNLAANFAKVGS